MSPSDETPTTEQRQDGAQESPEALAGAVVPYQEADGEKRKRIEAAMGTGVASHTVRRVSSSEREAPLPESIRISRSAPPACMRRNGRCLPR